MWLIILAIAAVISTALWYFKDEGRYKLELLSLIFWGATVMVFVDHAMGIVEDAFAGREVEFIEVSPSAFLLGVFLVCMGVALWEVYLLLKKPRIVASGERTR